MMRRSQERTQAVMTRGQAVTTNRQAVTTRTQKYWWSER